jgi:hypothetical protein
MNIAVLQIWEESDIKNGVNQDGCSIHLNIEERNNYINKHYVNNTKDMPSVYERIVGIPSSVFITDQLYNILTNEKSIRLMQNELNNLFNLQDIILKED